MSHGPSSDSGGAGQASDQARRWAGRPPAHHHDRTSLQHKAPSSGASEAMSHDHGSGPEATLPANLRSTTHSLTAKRASSGTSRPKLAGVSNRPARRGKQDAPGG